MVKVLEVPVSLPEWLVAVTVEPAPDWVTVTEVLARTPAVKALVWAQPAEQVRLLVRSTVPVKPVVVLPN